MSAQLVTRDRVGFNTLTSINSATFAGAYQAINTALTNPPFLIRIINNSNTDVTISYDGTNDHDFLPKNQSLQLNFQTNARPNGFVALLKANTIVYVKGAAGVGLVYFAAYFQDRQSVI